MRIKSLLRHVLPFCLVASFVIIFSLPSLVFAAKPTPTPPPSVKIICVDAGHGGTDTGATMTGVKGTITEAQENLDIAFKLQGLLQNSGYQVVMTRSNPDTTLGNTDRANICNNAGANYLVSIHLNGSTNHSMDYTEGLYGKMLKDKAWAQKINSAMNLGIPNNGITNFADGMLLKANMPATIAETVFLTSDSEYALLTDGTGNRQQQIAQALFNGISSP